MNHISSFLAQPPKNNPEAIMQLTTLLQPLYQDESKSIPERLAIRNLLAYIIDNLK